MTRMKTRVALPSEILQPGIAEKIRAEAAHAEVSRCLTAIQHNIIVEQQWFNMYVPKSHGGLELQLPEILKREEAIAWADGSTGWVVTLCSGAAWFVGFLSPSLINEVFHDKHVCFAGSGAVTGTAEKTKGRYQINGHWKYATGSLLATVFTMNCHVVENGVKLYEADGSPVIESFLLKRSEVKVNKTWHAMGMIATGSHSFEVNNVSVPSDRAFVIRPDQATSDNIIFQHPFLQLAETTLAVNISGMAFRFVELCETLLSKKHSHYFSEKIADIQFKLNETRDEFYEKCDNAWSVLREGRCIPDFTLHEVSRLSHQLVDASRAAVNALYAMCGLGAADTRTEINRVWRNFHTAAQHSLFTKHRPLSIKGIVSS
jgi:indole-3-acetate monooxygenase